MQTRNIWAPLKGRNNLRTTYGSSPCRESSTMAPGFKCPQNSTVLTFSKNDAKQNSETYKWSKNYYKKPHNTYEDWRIMTWDKHPTGYTCFVKSQSFLYTFWKCRITNQKYRSWYQIVRFYGVSVWFFSS